MVRIIQKYQKLSQVYMVNAFNSMQAGELEKASEFLWGSMAQAIKAVAAAKGQRLRSHDQIRGYMAALTKALQDPALDNAFLRASYLHSNFYESQLKAEEIYAYGLEIRSAVDKLLRMIPENTRGGSRARIPPT